MIRVQDIARSRLTVLLAHRPSRTQWVVAALILVAAWTCYAPTIAALVARPPNFVDQQYDGFDAGRVIPPQRLEVTGYHACAEGHGWCLGPRTAGSLTYYFTAKNSFPVLNAWLYEPPTGASRISVSLDQGKTYETVPHTFERTKYRMTRVLFPGPVQPGQEVAVRFEATNPADDTLLVLDTCRIVYRAGPARDLPGDTAVFGLVLSFGLAAVALCKRRLEAVTTVLILALGATLRYAYAVEVADMPLVEDALGYATFAQRMQLFSETGFFSARFWMREPFFIFVEHLYFKLIWPSDFSPRLLTVMLSTLSIWAVMAFGRGLFGRVPGQLLGLAMAVNTVLTRESPTALRLELEIVLLMVYFGLAFLKKWPRLLPAAVVLALVGAVLVLTRWSYVLAVLALNTWVLFRPREWRSSLAAVAVMILVLAAAVVPHRYNMYRVNGDAFYDMSMYAKWLRSGEFGGKPGFRSLEESRRDPYGGPPISYREYMFGLHTPTEIVEGTLRGYWKLFRAMSVYPYYWNYIPDSRTQQQRDRMNLVFHVAAGVGMLLALWIPAYRWIPLAFIIIEYPVSFLYDRNQVEPFRHSYSSFPLVLFAATIPIVMLASALARRRRHTAGEIEPDVPGDARTRELETATPT